MLLRTAEALMRHMLLIEAAHVSAPAAPPRARAKRIRPRRLVVFDPDKPEDWRVSFRCFSDRRRPRRPAPAHAVASRRSDLARGLRDAWPLALRYQALLRVFNDPYAYAKRLAARLRAKPERTSALLATPDNFFDRVDGAEEITSAAAGHGRTFDSS